MLKSLPAVLLTCCSPARRLCPGCLSLATSPGACAALSKGEAWASASGSASATSRGISPIRYTPLPSALPLGDSPPSTPSSPAGLLPAHSADGDVTGAGKRCCSGSPTAVDSVPSEVMAPTVRQPLAQQDLLSASHQAHDCLKGNSHELVCWAPMGWWFGSYTSHPGVLDSQTRGKQAHPVLGSSRVPARRCGDSDYLPGFSWTTKLGL